MSDESDSPMAADAGHLPSLRDAARAWVDAKHTQCPRHTGKGDDTKECMCGQIARVIGKAERDLEEAITRDRHHGS